MATITHVLTNPDTAQTSIVTSAFTPAAGEVLVVFVVNSGSATNTIGGGPVLTSSVAGQRFNRIAVVPYNALANQIAAFIGEALTTAVSQTLTFDSPNDSTSGQVVFVCSVSGLQSTGIEAVRQFAPLATQAGPSTTGPTFASAALTGNPCLVCVGNLLNPAAITPPSGWTELGDSGYNTPTTGGEYAGINSGFTGTAITLGSSVSTYAALAIELDAGTPPGIASLKQTVSSFTTASGNKTAVIAAAVGEVAVAVVANTGNAAAATVTDDNADGLGSYTEVVSALKNASADRIAIFIRNAEFGSAGSTTITMAPGVTTGGGLVALRVANIQAGSSGVRGSGAQSNGASGTPSNTLSTAADPSDFVVAGIFNAATGGIAQVNNLADRDGWLTYGTPTTSLIASSRSYGFPTGATVGWQSAVAAYGDVGAAIKQAVFTSPVAGLFDRRTPRRRMIQRM